MKKIYSFVFAAIAILSAASCQKELVNAPEADTNAAPFSFVAEREAETKTVLVDGKSTWWTPGDKVSAFDSKGEAVTFATNIPENSASALFACELFSLPEDLIVHAIYPDRAGVSTLKDGIINNLRVAGSQQAVAGSFDPRYAVAYAKGQITSMESAPELTFTNIHSLVKFTIGGDTAPETIRLKTFAQRMCVGTFWYNTQTGEMACSEGGHEVNLLAPEGGFKVGETYYIALVPGATKQLTLYFDDKVAFTAGEGVIKTLEANKIYNLGEVSMPEEKPQDPEYETDFAKRVWGKYAPDSEGWIVMGAGNLDRGMAMDNQYIYVSKSTAYAPVIKAFNYDGTEAFECDVTGMGGSNQWGDAMQYSVNCVRTMPKADGSYILIACNLKLDANQVLEIWAWVNGPQSAPTCIGRYAYDSVANAQDHRRYGDRFSVKGTWEDGELWFPSMQADDHGKTIVFKTFAGVDNSNRPSTELEDRGYHRMEPSQSNMKDLAFYPDADEVFSTCNANAKFVKLDGTTHSTGWLNWAVTDDYSSTHLRTYSYNFFEVNGKKYIAYVKIDEQNGRTGRLVVIEDGDGTLAGFKSALTANTVVFEAPLQHTSDFDTESAASTGNTLGNCNVIAKDGVTYIGAHIQGLGLSLFQIK